MSFVSWLSKISFFQTSLLSPQGKPYCASVVGSAAAGTAVACGFTVAFGFAVFFGFTVAFGFAVFFGFAVAFGSFVAFFVVCDFSDAACVPSAAPLVT